ncbi:MAG: cytochrome b [Pseudomonadales bacterium]|nr:cytochrome b [Pseudomonadales bacterium]
MDSLIALMLTIAAVVITVMLNGSSSRLRTAGTVLASIACLVCVLWFFLVMQTGILGSPREPTLPTDELKPALLWIFTVISLIGGLFLLWAALEQRTRTNRVQLSNDNSAGQYGRVSRYLHWITAILFLSLFPIGIFATMIPEGTEWRPSYYAVHKTIGILVFILVFIRVMWHVKSTRPALDPSLRSWEKNLARIAHYGLYFLMITLPITGFAMSTYAGNVSKFFTWELPLLWAADDEAIKLWGLLHKIVLPYLFYGLFTAHLVGAVKHHFIDKHPKNIRRILS